MRLTAGEARARLVAHDHGVLCTLHPARGVDAVPVVYATVGDHVAVPVDTVKPKASTSLQRGRNLAADPRATLLVECWDRDDWSRLWWVRAELRHVSDPPAALVEALSSQLAGAFRQYRDRPFAGLLVLRIAGVHGWAAAVAP